MCILYPERKKKCWNNSENGKKRELQSYELSLPLLPLLSSSICESMNQDVPLPHFNVIPPSFTPFMGRCLAFLG